MDKTTIKILIFALLIAFLGILSIYSSTYQKEGALWDMIPKRQVLWVLLGVLCFIGVYNSNYRRLWDWTYLLYGILLCLLSLVFIIGIVRLGAQRWLKIAWVNFQPSEFVKLSIVIFLARYFSAKSADNISLKIRNYGLIKAFLWPSLFVAIPAGLIMEQPDLGSATIIIIIFIAMLFLANVKFRYIVLFFSVVMLAMPFIWDYLRGYQKDRLLVFLNPNADPLGAGYTIIQSKIAIGSGGFLGKGWLAGTQNQLHFLPESHTDFIFAVFCEEWGFLGAFILLLLYFLLIQQGFLIAERTQDNFGRLMAYGISMMLGIQVFINIAMNLGLAPVVGLPLPLMSYGGSSVIVTFAYLGILANINRKRTVF